MQLTVTGKQVDVGGALRRTSKKVSMLSSQYFRTAIEAHAVFAREAHLIRTDLSVAYRPRHHDQERATAPDYYPAFDAAAKRLASNCGR